ncbi:MAG: HAD family phosphatase [Thermotogota bacterium]|nr:HAD family phosphatase [Thermotogota bacterium]
MIKGLIFDMDGVLIDSEPLYKTLDGKLFKELGFSLTDEEYAHFVGTTDEKMLRDLKEKFSLDQSVDEMNQLREEIHMTFFKSAKLYPMQHLHDLLDLANDKALKLAVASSTDEKFVLLILEKIGILDYFQTVVCGNHIDHSKPVPDIFLKAAEELELKPGQCLVIEDSTNGVKAGKNAGMTVIGFQSDDGSQDLSESHKKVYSLKEAKAVIEELL